MISRKTTITGRCIFHSMAINKLSNQIFNHNNQKLNTPIFATLLTKPQHYLTLLFPCHGIRDKKQAKSSLRTLFLGGVLRWERVWQSVLSPELVEVAPEFVEGVLRFSPLKALE